MSGYSEKKDVSGAQHWIPSLRRGRIYTRKLQDLSFFFIIHFGIGFHLLLVKAIANMVA